MHRAPVVMSQVIGEELNDDLYRRLSGGDLEACAGKALLIVTIDDRGWPHPAVLSYFEVVARDRRNLRLAAYADSSTTGNMRRTGRLTLLLIDERVAYYVKGTVEEMADRMRCTPYNAKLNVRVDRVLADEANAEVEGGACVVSGVTYRTPDAAGALARGRAVIAELLE